MIEMIVSELEQEADAIRRTLAAVPPEKYSWKPHEKSLSAGALALHIASLPRGIVQAVLAGSFDVKKAGPTFESCSTREQLLNLFEDSLKFALEELRKMSPEDEKAVWRIVDGDKTRLEMPRIAALRTVLLNHIYHHRGQLTVYLRLLDVPVPSVYGPTADVRPF